MGSLKPGCGVVGVTYSVLQAQGAMSLVMIIVPSIALSVIYLGLISTPQIRHRTALGTVLASYLK